MTSWEDVRAEVVDQQVSGELCPDCGKIMGTFACKIRHLQINTGAAKAANDG